MTSMVERVAKAIYETMPVGERGWEDAPAYTANRCREIARAAIAAMHEPTREMCLSPASEPASRYDEDTAIAYFSEVWRSMIDAALKE